MKSTVAEPELEVDTDRRRVTLRGTEVEPPLSREQFDLLAYLYDNAGRLCRRESIIERVWSDLDAAGVSDQAVDSLVHRTRERVPWPRDDRVLHRHVLRGRTVDWALLVPYA